MLMIELILTARLSCVEGAGYYFVQATRGKHAKKKKKKNEWLRCQAVNSEN